MSSKWYRVLPLFPLLIGTIVVIAKDGIWSPTMKLDDSIVKGVVSGGAASYVFRTAKVVLFGKVETEEKKDGETK